MIDNVIRIHKELHGKGATVEAIIADLDITNSQTIEEYIISRLNVKSSEQFGVFIGRCQPFHLGHQAVVNEIMLDGKKPIIVLGSINKQDEKNPLTYRERYDLIKLVYPKDVIITGCKDNVNWDLWFEGLINSILQSADTIRDNITIFYHNKPDDRLDFVYKDIEYKNEFYTKVFEIEGIKMKQIDFVNRDDFKIQSNGRDIRHNIEGFKHFLDARVYWSLKEKCWK